MESMIATPMNLNHFGQIFNLSSRHERNKSRCESLRNRTPPGRNSLGPEVGSVRDSKDGAARGEVCPLPAFSRESGFPRKRQELLRRNRRELRTIFPAMHQFAPGTEEFRESRNRFWRDSIAVGMALQGPHFPSRLSPYYIDLKRL